MNKMDLQRIIATDDFNLLRDGENPLKYWLKRMWYKLVTWRQQ